MNKYITNELIENTYLFCVKRVADSEAAKDLSQDILYEALRAINGGKSFQSFHSWYWRMARNKYADYVSYKQNPALPIEVAGGVAADIMDSLDGLIAAEDISELHFSLSRLASIHRDVIIRFYLKEQSVAQIAGELQIPQGTVKRRLFDAKKNLQERITNMNYVGTSSYAPAEVYWFWGFNARAAEEVLSHQKIAQQACVICRGEAKTINEIADEMGVAPIYLEPILKQMTDTSLLASPGKDKYCTNFCVFPEQAYLNAILISCREFRKKEFHKRTSEILLGLKNQITALDFYGNDFDYSYLMWQLYVTAGDAIGTVGRNRYLEKYAGKYQDETERKYRVTMMYVLPEETVDYSMYDSLKSTGWSNLHQQFLTTDYGKLEYVNDFECEPFPNEGNTYIHGRDNWVNGNNISLLLALSRNPHKELNSYEEEMAAEFIKNGLLKKSGDSLIVQLPILKRSVAQQIYEIVWEAVRELACEYSDIIGAEIEKLLLPYVRKDLMSNFIHWDMRQFFQTTSYLFYYGMYESDCLAIPDDYSCSAAGLYILTE